MVPCTNRERYGLRAVAPDVHVKMLNMDTTDVSTRKYICTCIYSQTCIERSPLGERKSDLIRKMTS